MEIPCLLSFLYRPDLEILRSFGVLVRLFPADLSAAIIRSRSYFARESSRSSAQAVSSLPALSIVYCRMLPDVEWDMFKPELVFIGEIQGVLNGVPQFTQVSRPLISRERLYDCGTDTGNRCAAYSVQTSEEAINEFRNVFAPIPFHISVYNF